MQAEEILNQLDRIENLIGPLRARAIVGHKLYLAAMPYRKLDEGLAKVCDEWERINQ